MWRTPARVGGPDERAVLLAPVLGLGGGHHEEGVDALERGDRGLLVGVLADPDVALDVGGAPGVADEQAQVEAEVGSGEGAGDQPAEGSGGPGDSNHVVGNLAEASCIPAAAGDDRSIRTCRPSGTSSVNPSVR